MFLWSGYGNVLCITYFISHFLSLFDIHAHTNVHIQVQSSHFHSLYLSLSHSLSLAHTRARTQKKKTTSEIEVLFFPQLCIHWLLCHLIKSRAISAREPHYCRCTHLANKCFNYGCRSDNWDQVLYCRRTQLSSLRQERTERFLREVYLSKLKKNPNILTSSCRSHKAQNMTIYWCLDRH